MVSLPEQGEVTDPAGSGFGVEGKPRTLLGAVFSIGRKFRRSSTSLIYRRVSILNHSRVTVIGRAAVLTAQVTAEVMIIAGEINGDVTASYVEMLSTARVRGNVTTPALVIHEGAVFEGSCLVPLYQTQAFHGLVDRDASADEKEKAHHWLEARIERGRPYGTGN
jgi:bactofilin